MYTFRNKIAAALVIAAFAAPMMASAETTANISLSSDMQVRIQALLSQIKALQEQIKTLVGSSTFTQGWNNGSSTMGMPVGQMGKMACISLTRNLRQGDQGDDVKSIQQLLLDDPNAGFTGSATGFFGPLTMKAMMHFQMNNGIASSTDGSVGPLTRGFFERRCGKGLDGMQGGMGKMPGGDMMNVMWVRGTISANNTSSITVSTDGNSVVVNITASTSIKVFAGTSTSPTVGSVTDLTVGKHVLAGGKKNSDGSIQATEISVGDNLPMMKGPGDNGGSGMPPMGMMPTLDGSQHGPGTNGYGPQNW
jgi:peptidoglycan hydrolase-like protein with peptidoglycan-binding domain